MWDVIQTQAGHVCIFTRNRSEPTSIGDQTLQKHVEDCLRANDNIWSLPCSLLSRQKSSFSCSKSEARWLTWTKAKETLGWTGNWTNFGQATPNVEEQTAGFQHFPTVLSVLGSAVNFLGAIEHIEPHSQGSCECIGFLVLMRCARWCSTTAAKGCATFWNEA